MRRDPYNSEKIYCRWKQKLANGIPGITDASIEVISQYLTDMEQGVNVSRIAGKGPRSYLRLNASRAKLLFLARLLEERFNAKSIVEIEERDLHRLFKGMRSGEIRKKNGGIYKSTGDYVTTFKAFWHWYMRVQKKNGNEQRDICLDLDDRDEKPKWVHLTEEDVKRLCREAKFKYRVLMMFLLDSGIRSPGELINIKVDDLGNGYRELHIRDETSKTFGRKIKLLLCPSLLKEHVKEQGLGQQDYLFSISPPVVNRYLKRLGKRVLGEKKSPGGAPYSRLTMYDFRHSSACYWLPRYKSESALKYRFGWKKSEMIHYYTNFLGMRDTITEDDLLVDVSKTEIEKRLERAEKEKELLQEQVQAMERQMQEILQSVRDISKKVA